jgi:LemA protein
MKRTTLIIVVLLGLFGVYGCSSYNGLVQKDETVKGAWSKVQTQYQRRADLIPNLVNTVKGAADFEKETLTQVIQARASATSMNIDAGDLTPENKLSGALSRLLVSVERYPELKANQNFLDLQAQLEGTENRIAVARNDFNTTVQDYNQSVRVFPAAIFAGLFGFDQKGYFEGTEASQTAPSVAF